MTFQPKLAPALAQEVINYLNRVPTTGLDDASRLLGCAEALQHAGNAGAADMNQAGQAEAAPEAIVEE